MSHSVCAARRQRRLGKGLVSGLACALLLVACQMAHAAGITVTLDKADLHADGKTQGITAICVSPESSDLAQNCTKHTFAGTAARNWTKTGKAYLAVIVTENDGPIIVNKKNPQDFRNDRTYHLFKANGQWKLRDPAKSPAKSE